MSLHQRKSYTALSKIYFWTATIHKWYPLLEPDLMFKGNQVDGNLVGTATHYYENGKPERELYYKDGKVFLVNYWDSSGVQKIIKGKDIKKF